MTNYRLKNTLIQEKSYQCEICKISDWNGNKLTLEMDHIDGDRSNNNLSNLRLLCPNCHSQTKTWRGRNITKPHISDEELIVALSETKNIRQALISVGLTPKGANYTRASKLLNHPETTIDNKNSQYGTLWVTKNQTNRKIKAIDLEEYLSLGWIKGRHLDITPPSNKGKYWTTNGIENTMCKSDELPPEGWWKGRAC